MLVKNKDSKSWPALALGGVAFLVYLFTLYPSVGGGDSGELITAGYKFSVPHPPGYPLYIVLAKLFSFIPFNSIAWRINLLSSVCDAAATVFLAMAVTRWTKQMWAGVLAGGLFCFSPLVWNYAITAEVFALNNLFVSLLLYLSVRFFEDYDPKFFLTASFIVGLGLSNHHTLVFYGAILLPAMLWFHRTKPKIVIGSVVLFILGLLPYAILPLASANLSLAQWGDERSLNGFLNQLLRRDYGTFQLGASGSFAEGSSFLSQITKFSQNLFQETLFIGVIMAAFGLWRSYKNKSQRPLVIFTVVAFVFYVIVFHALANLPIEDPLTLAVQSRFWQQTLVFVCAWVGLGFAALPIFKSNHKIALVMTTVVLQLGLHFKSNNHRDDWTMHGFGLATLNTIPKDALLLTQGDHYRNAIMYLQSCEQVRTDVKSVHIATLTYPWGKELFSNLYPDVHMPSGEHLGNGSNEFQIKSLIDANIKSMPVWNCGGFPAQDQSYENTYDLWTKGLCDELHPKDARVDEEAWQREAQQNLANIRRTAFKDEPITKFSLDSWEYSSYESYWQSLLRVAHKMLILAIARGASPDQFSQIAKMYEIFLDEYPKSDAAVFKNLGIAYDRSGKPAERDLMWKKYLQVAPPSDADLPTIRAHIQGK